MTTSMRRQTDEAPRVGIPGAASFSKRRVEMPEVPSLLNSGGAVVSALVMLAGRRDGQELDRRERRWK